MSVTPPCLMVGAVPSHEVYTLTSLFPVPRLRSCTGQEYSTSQEVHRSQEYFGSTLPGPMAAKEGTVALQEALHKKLHSHQNLVLQSQASRPQRKGYATSQEVSCFQDIFHHKQLFIVQCYMYISLSCIQKQFS